MFKKVMLLFLGIFCVLNLSAVKIFADDTSQTVTVDPAKIQLFFFWGQGCPHCAVAKPFLQDLEKKYPQLQILSFEIYNNEANQKIAQDFAQIENFQFEGVPTIIIGDQHTVGFADVATSGKDVENLVKNCIDTKCQINPKINQYLIDNKVTSATGIDNAESATTEKSTTGASNTKLYYYLIPIGVIVLFGIIFALSRKPKR